MFVTSNVDVPSSFVWVERQDACQLPIEVVALLEVDNDRLDPRGDMAVCRGCNSDKVLSLPKPAAIAERSAWRDMPKRWVGGGTPPGVGAALAA